MDDPQFYSDGASGSSNWFSSIVGLAGGVAQAAQALNAKNEPGEKRTRLAEPTAPAPPGNSRALLIIGGAIVALIVLVFAIRK
jgi:hypothetical protein